MPNENLSWQFQPDTAFSERDPAIGKAVPFYRKSPLLVPPLVARKMFCREK